MAKQEAIREGIAKTIYGDWAIGSVSWEKTLPAERTPWLKTADLVIEYENSQGVVLKVDRELPYEVKLEGGTFDYMDEDYHSRLKAGYVATEPLIKEVDEIRS